jgi:hypothetical protein
MVCTSILMTVSTCNYSNYYSQIAHKIDMDAYGLAQVYRRVKDAAQAKYKLDTDDAQNSEMHNPLPKGLDIISAKKHKYLGRSLVFSAAKKTMPGGARKRYQDLLQMQQVASVVLDDYLEYRNDMYEMQHERLLTLGHCATLVQQLTHPPSLDEAMQIIRGEYKESHESKNTPTPIHGNKELFSSDGIEKSFWLQGLPLNGLEDAVAAHLRTDAAMEAVASRAAGDPTRRSRWSVVAAPHDLTGPPVDLLTLPSIQNETLIARAFPYDNINSLADKEESLWWVAYAAQTTHYPESHRDEEGVGSDLRGGWTAEGQPRGSEAQRRAQELLGQVKGEELLQRVAVDVMSMPDRRALLEKMCIQEEERSSRLSKVLREDVINRIRGKNSAFQLGFLDQETHQERLLACIKIQAFVRGTQSRVLTSERRTEKRVLSALAVLISELSITDTNKKGKAFSLLNKIQTAIKAPAFARPKNRPHSTPPPAMRRSDGVATSNSKKTTDPSSWSASLIRPRDVHAPEIASKTSASSPISSSQKSGKSRKRLAQTSTSSESKSLLNITDESDPEDTLDPLSYISSPSYLESSLEMSSQLFSPKSPAIPYSKIISPRVATSHTDEKPSNSPV